MKTQREEKFRTELSHANRYLDDLDYEKAIAAYRAAIDIDPKDPKPYIGMADAYIGLGDYESARDILEEGYGKYCRTGVCVLCTAAEWLFLGGISI